MSPIIQEFPMSIRARLIDAMILWEHGRKEGAWALVLIATAATSRKRYPKTMMGDRASFSQFIREIQGTIIIGEFPLPPMEPIVIGGVPIEDLIYEHMRNNLVHEAELHPRVVLAKSRVVNGILGAELRLGAVNEIPDFWVINLAKAVALAAENSAELPRDANRFRIDQLVPEMPRPGFASLADQQHEHRKLDIGEPHRLGLQTVSMLKT
jgi:hypothetical protein